MKLHLTHKPASLPFHSPIRTAHGLWQTRDLILLKLETGNSTRYAEVSPIPHFGTETQSAALAQLQQLGTSPTSDSLHNIPATFPALSSALHQLLTPATPPFHHQLSVSALLPAGTSSIQSARQKAADGYTAFKWKIGTLPIDDELTILDDLLAELPPSAKLRLDANGSLTLAQAQRWLAASVDRPVEFLEQPIRYPDNLAKETDHLLGLANDYPVKIALDESITTTGTLTHWLDQNWPGIFTIKPALLHNPHKILRQLSARNADIVFSSSLETPVGLHQLLSLAFSFPTKTPRALGLPSQPLFQNSVFNVPLTPTLDTGILTTLNPAATWTALN